MRALPRQVRNASRSSRRGKCERSAKTCLYATWPFPVGISAISWCPAASSDRVNRTLQRVTSSAPPLQGPETNPISRAMTAARVRSEAPSLARMRCTWLFTVLVPIQDKSPGESGVSHSKAPPGPWNVRDDFVVLPVEMPADHLVIYRSAHKSHSRKYAWPQS